MNKKKGTEVILTPIGNSQHTQLISTNFFNQRTRNLKEKIFSWTKEPETEEILPWKNYSFPSNKTWFIQINQQMSYLCCGLFIAKFKMQNRFLFTI